MSSHDFECTINVARIMKHSCSKYSKEGVNK